MSIVDYIHEQPRAVAAAIAAARDWRAQARPAWGPARGGLHFVGSGSSRNAILAAAPSFAAAGWAPIAIHGPSRFVADARAGRIAGGVVVVLSQSGASVTSIEAAMAARVAGRDVLSITAEAASPLARGGGPLLVMPIGPEPIGPKTKGFTASVATLLALAGAPGDPGASFAIALAAAPDWAGRLIDRADRADMVLVTASGALYGIALEASLKIAEIAGIPTACFPWEEVLHGRLHGLTPASVCVVIVDDARTRAEAERARIAMHARGVAIDLLDLADDLPPPWSILAGVTPFQWLAVRLAERRGMAPEAMRYPGLSADLAIKTNPPP